MDGWNSQDLLTGKSTTLPCSSKQACNQAVRKSRVGKKVKMGRPTPGHGGGGGTGYEGGSGKRNEGRKKKVQSAKYIKRGTTPTSFSFCHLPPPSFAFIPVSTVSQYTSHTLRLLYSASFVVALNFRTHFAIPESARKKERYNLRKENFEGRKKWERISKTEFSQLPVVNCTAAYK
ncbi:unnamed protein product [Tuber melanosporum]|uniref:(Perigord truffle) hypothetical protein n=1 Tax=Tuber melanosporum (strain Mel28) TaxID=656061 RepID=D5GPT5_TUBMM|nr:uncharacterized protein GSTUM_00012024001 [Tuber melanosporum]CAZ86528.1 unnamed protein product [Tuber melanosporum]